MMLTPPPPRPVPRRPMLLRASLVLITLACGSTAIAAQDGEAPDARTMIVTSDSGAYCRTLSGVIDAHGALPREVKELKTQGDWLCNEGQVRGGIARLRRALIVLHKEPPADELPPR